MRGPDLVVRQRDLDETGRLGAETAEDLANRLRQGHYVLLPSDTAYSLAAIPVSATVRDNLNTILNVVLGRPANMEVSLAFDSVETVWQWIDENPIVERLIKRFCPGPITVVCAAKSDATVIPHRYFRYLAAKSGTIGIRVPDSPIERQIAAAARSPITTTAVRERDNSVVQDFDRALEIVGAGMESVPELHWSAVEGSRFREDHSTVVLVTRFSEELMEIRPGVIPFAEIETAARG